MTYGTKSIKLTLDFDVADRDYFLALFKAFAQSLKPNNTDTDSAAASLAEESIPQKPAKDGAAKKEQPTGGIRKSTKPSNGEKTLSDYEEDKAASIRMESQRKSVKRNEWYELFEYRVNDNQSIFDIEISSYNSDSGMGVGVVAGSLIDIAKLASPRGFTYFRVPKTKPAEKFPKHVKELLANKKRGGITLVVEFYSDKPDDMDQVFDVSATMKIAEPDFLESKQNRQELSKKMQAKYGNRYAVYEMNPYDLREDERLHLEAYLLKGNARKPLGATSLGPESFPGHSRLAVAIVDGNAVIERWNQDGTAGNTWRLKDDIKNRA